MPFFQHLLIRLIYIHSYFVTLLAQYARSLTIMILPPGPAWSHAKLLAILTLDTEGSIIIAYNIFYRMSKMLQILVILSFNISIHLLTLIMHTYYQYLQQVSNSGKQLWNPKFCHISCTEFCRVFCSGQRWDWACRIQFHC